MLALTLPAAHTQILQPTGPLPSFEVATIKPSSPNATGSRDQFSGSGLAIENRTLADIFKLAYNINVDAQLILPDWARATRYDINARIDEPTTIALQKLPPGLRSNQVRLMLQSLLIDRFNTKATVQTRELPAYALVPVKAGQRLTLSPCAPSCPNIGTSGGNGVLEGKNAPIEMLVAALTRQPELAGRTVIDETRLKSNYNWTLHWTPQDNTTGADLGPPLFVALQEQLGLKLESAKRPIEVLVVEHLDHPSEN